MRQHPNPWGYQSAIPLSPPKKTKKKMTFRTATYAPGGSVLDAGCVLQNLTLAMGIEWG